MVRTLQNDRADSRRDRRPVQRQDPDRQAEHRRQSGDPAQVQYSRHPDIDPVQKRHRGGPESRSSHQVTARRLSGQQPVRGYLGNQSRGGGQGGGQQGGQGGGQGGGRSNRSNRGPRNDNRNGNTNGGRPPVEDYGDLPEVFYYLKRIPP